MNRFTPKARTPSSHFQWNDYAKSLFLKESFDQWNAANDDLPTDEIVWFDEEQARIVAVPYENLIQFKCLSGEGHSLA